MAKYQPRVGDAIRFTYWKTKHGKQNGSENHTGIVEWVASSNKFLTVYPHSIPINNAKGEPIDMSWIVETSSIIGLVK